MFQPQQITTASIPSGYKITHSQHPPARGRRDEGPTNTASYEDPATGYRAYGEAGCVKYHRASLPRLSYGHNGRLIPNQAELDAAVGLLQAKTEEIANPPRCSYYLTRVDLVWQFRCDPAAFILAHRHARHARLRCDPTRYESRSMALEGSEMRISFYDKVLERFKRNGDVLRVEVQLRGDRLKEELGNGARVTRLVFADCYAAFRRIMLGFCLPPIERGGKIAQLLAMGERAGWQSDGIPAFDLYTGGMSGRHVRRLQKQMAAWRPMVFQIDWAQILPVDGPPAVVDVEERDVCRSEVTA
jgi:hypothetical protein